MGQIFMDNLIDHTFQYQQCLLWVNNSIHQVIKDQKISSLLSVASLVWVLWNLVAWSVYRTMQVMILSTVCLMAAWKHSSRGQGMTFIIRVKNTLLCKYVPNPFSDTEYCVHHKNRCSAENVRETFSMSAFSYKALFEDVSVHVIWSQ